MSRARDIANLVDANGDIVLGALDNATSTLDGATDTNITSVADNDLLAYDSASGKWTNQTASEAGIDVTDIAWSSTVQTGNFTAASGNGYFVNTASAAITVTLPASPSLGDRLSIIDISGSADTNQITVGRNGSNINGASADFLISSDRQAVTMIYSDSTNGWIVENDGNARERALTSSYSAEVMVIAGGGSGAAGYGNGNGSGGGGAGGFQVVSLSILRGVDYTATVGAGGATQSTNRGSNAGGAPGNDGQDSSFSTITSIGGGGGGSPSLGGQIGRDGGSGGGGGSGAGQAGGSGTTGQGNDGGSSSTGSLYRGGGGGGAGSAGINGNSRPNGGAGSNAYSSWATATSTGVSGYYAGGGGGGDYTGNNNAGLGGSGGGGAGRGGTNSGVAATANTGSGGGGGGSPSTGSTGGSGGAGGSGLIIIRYAGSQEGTGGTVVTTGGYTYHTFTSSGTYTG